MPPILTLGIDGRLTDWMGAPPVTGGLVAPNPLQYRIIVSPVW
jgi:hypothetical protein